ncbi:MAG: acetylxylan esterase, partial [Alistipes sp.]|nr:acetylxylan esterase [Alistipes sp.]
DVDATRVAIMGHSRGAKLAAWAAVNDARFAVAILNNSGCAGAALFRRKFGEHAHRLNRSFPYWMCENFHKYNERDYAIPVDQHQLLALIAPRPLYVASGAEDLWADPKGEFLGLAHAEPIYNLYGYQGVATMEWPAIDTPIGHRAAYHVRRGGHGVLPYDWQQYIRFVDKWLKK